jgi:PKD repeat protein
MIDITEAKIYYISVLAPFSASGPTGNMTPPPPQFNIPPIASGPTANITHGPIVANTSPLDYSHRANFSGSPRYGNAPLGAHFTDESTANPISWVWDFDNDGNIDSWEQNPSHNYVNPGTYTVFLSISTGNMTWSTETKIDYIVVLSPPYADFNSSKTYGNSPYEVHFTDNSTGDINYWNWDFDGDGTVDSREQNPSYTYTEAGKYTVSLTVGEITSSTETKVYYITVLDPRGGGDGGGDSDNSDDGGEEPGGGEEPI